MYCNLIGSTYRGVMPGCLLSYYAEAIANHLASHTQVEKVYYPGLSSQPQFELAKAQQLRSGAVVSFEVKGGREAAYRVIDSTELMSITANLGDTKTTITHPFSTTHARWPDEDKMKAGITEGMIRIAVGLEHVDDLIQDLEPGLAGAK